MRDFASRGGFTLMKTPSHRQQAQRRRLLVVCAMLGLALGAGVVGSMTHNRGEVVGEAGTGPFSYFPSE